MVVGFVAWVLPLVLALVEFVYVPSSKTFSTLPGV
jgi:hypothetical protein